MDPTIPLTRLTNYLLQRRLQECGAETTPRPANSHLSTPGCFHSRAHAGAIRPAAGRLTGVGPRLLFYAYVCECVCIYVCVCIKSVCVCVCVYFTM